MPDWSVATWNVNSIRTRLDHVLSWAEAQRPDVLCLQETKAVEEQFPFAEIRAAGWHVVQSGQKSYNGVALLSREPLEDVQPGFSGDPDPSKARVLSGLYQGARIITVYVPNGSEVDSPKYAYKLDWLAALNRWLREEQDPAAPVVLLGDFNIAPDDRDVYEPELFRDRVLCSAPERDALQTLQDWGLEDLFRRHEQEGAHYSWWDYRAARFRRKQGLRIDLILATAPLAARSVACRIDSEPRGRERPSDHAPVLAVFSG